MFNKPLLLFSYCNSDNIYFVIYNPLFFMHECLKLIDKKICALLCFAMVCKRNSVYQGLCLNLMALKTHWIYNFLNIYILMHLSSLIDNQFLMFEDLSYSYVYTYLKLSMCMKSCVKKKKKKKGLWKESVIIFRAEGPSTNR